MAVVGVGAASLRVSASLSPDPLERIAAAAALAVAFAVVCALGLGLVGLGADPFLLTGLAVVAWVAARMFVPVQVARPLRAHAAEALGRLGTRGALAVGVIMALAAVAVVYSLAQPVTGIDAAHYHLPEALAWLQSGHPGSIEFVEPQVPVGYQPLTHEVLLGWLLAIERGFTPLPFVSVGLLALAGVAAWLGLTRLAVPRQVASLSVAVLVTMPLLLGVATWPKNDIAVIAWLATAGALLVCARERPRLAGPALVALGLALGTKSTALIPVFFVALIGLWALRERLGGVRGIALAGVAGGLAVSAPWYIRDLIDNGSPLWPYLALPGGRPVIPFVADAASFAGDPIETLRLTVPINALLAGPTPALLLLGAVACAVVSRSGPVLAATGVALLGVAAWAIAPFTGVAAGATIIEIWGAAANVRYALPALLVALLAVTLASRRNGFPALVARATLILGLVANVVTLALVAFRPPSFTLAPAAWLVVAVLVGAAAGFLCVRIPARRLVSVPVLSAAGLVVVAAIAVAAPGYPERHETIGLIAPPELMRFLEADPRWQAGEGVVAMGPLLFAPAAGARLEHPLHLVTPATLCDYVERAPQGWLALTTLSHAPDQFAAERERCLGDVQPALDTTGLKVYALPVR